MTQDVLIATMSLLPQLLWFLLVAILVLVFYRPVRYELISKLARLKLMGVEIDFVQRYIDAALELAEKSKKWQVQVSQQDKERAMARARRCQELFRGTQVLWIDDQPENNINERRMFRKLHVDIDTAISSDQAFAMLREARYDVILSDMARGDDPSAGISFLQRYVENTLESDRIPLIFYIGVRDSSKGTPAFAFGLAHKPDELLHLVIDVLDRRNTN
ncbi:MAG: hypothetical protein OEW08_14900 [Gammaproteobacteria bacterium]|nr:hypothetical protein [Gammaproteobacteria bacterium]